MKTKIISALLMSAMLLFGQGRGGGRNLTWDESLNLTTEQMQQITELREAMQPAMQSMRQSTRNMELELRELLGADEANADRIAELETAMAANELAMDALMAGHREQIRSLLTADQQLVFDQHQFGPREGRGPRMDGNRRGGNRPGGPMGGRPGHGRR